MAPSRARLLLGVILAVTVAAGPPARRANMLHVVLPAPSGVSVRAIWRPYHGAEDSTGYRQQSALARRIRTTQPDSLRRWRDPASRDTLVVTTPSELFVDMSGGPISIEVDGGDSVRVEAQQSHRRGPTVVAWGRSFLITADGRQPTVTRRR